MDVELDVENTELSPGVRRMLATLGQDAAFEHGRQQMERPAGLSVTTKAVERTAEAIGGDIEVRQQRDLQQALQLGLPGNESPFPEQLVANHEYPTWRRKDDAAGRGCKPAKGGVLASRRR